MDRFSLKEVGNQGKQFQFELYFNESRVETNTQRINSL